jgi:hypothetical protein
MKRSTEKVTFPWLYHNVTMQVWGTLAGFVVAAFVGGVSLGQTTFIQELLGKQPPPPRISSEELKNKVDQLIQGHNESIKSLYEAIANEEKEAGKVYFVTEQAPHVDSANRLKATLKQENETFERQLKALRDLEK